MGQDEHISVQDADLMQTAVVILNYNGQHHLERFLPDILQNTSKHARIIIADNASDDGSVNWLGQHYPELEIIKLDRNYGFAEGYNRALQQVSADYFVLLNSDVRPAPGWLEPLIAWLKSSTKHAACQPKILAEEDPSKFEFAGASGGFLDSWCYPFCRGRIFFGVEKDEGQYDDTREVFWASGASLAIKSDLYFGLGGLDASYFAHMEEIDLCWRLKRAGYSIGIVPHSVVYHLGGGTLPQESQRKVFLNFRNSLKTIVKNEPLTRLLWFIPFRLVLDGLAGMFYLRQGRWKFFTAVIKAHLAFYRSFPATLRARREVRWGIERYHVGPENKLGRYHGFLIVDFFLRGIDKFSDLHSNGN